VKSPGGGLTIRARLLSGLHLGFTGCRPFLTRMGSSGIDSS